MSSGFVGSSKDMSAFVGSEEKVDSDDKSDATSDAASAASAADAADAASLNAGAAMVMWRGPAFEEAVREERAEEAAAKVEDGNDRAS